MPVSINNEIIFSSVNRAAFPACRVFIYGHEVTDDVISARVDHSGGSLERRPGTCSITLANVLNKYTLKNDDILSIGKYKGTIDRAWSASVEALSSDVFRSSGDPIVYKDPINDSIWEVKEGSNNTATIDHIKGEVDPYPLGKTGLSLDTGTIHELALKLSGASSQEMFYLLQSLSASSDTPLVLSLADAEALSSQIIQEKKKMDRTSAKGGAVVGSWDVLDVPYAIKREVVNRKLEYTITARPTSSESELLIYPDKIIYDYPMQEGDCIFHPNDPIRVAFRDPFDPRKWYWMFTGFIDTWTDDTGVNFDSRIVISCTDVSKMARYAIAGSNVGLRDPNQSFEITKEAGGTIAKTNPLFQAEAFKDLSIPEILEIIFFGSESAVKLKSANAFEQTQALSMLTKDELSSFFQDRYGATLEQIYGEVGFTTSSTPLRDLPSASKTALLNKTLDYLQTHTETKLDALEWPDVSSPRNVRFKRNLDKQGVNFYVYGEPDAVDKIFNATELKDLYSWNEVIHHMVKPDDLVTMRIDTPSFGSNFTLSNYSTLGIPSSVTIDDTIFRIGTDMDNYPVGHGRVIYLAPAKLNTALGNGLLNKDLANISSTQSSFRDRLSHLYDVADAADWRFYATPKGDIVFEMPFYDWDPIDFVKSSDTSRDLSDTNKDLQLNYRYTFQEYYDGNYTKEEADSLTELEGFTERSDESNIDTFDKYDKRLVTPEFDYGDEFRITTADQSSSSNTNTDNGVLTAYRCKSRFGDNFDALQNSEINNFKGAIDKSLVPTLGWRLGEGQVWGFITTPEGAEMYSALQLNKLNAEARSLGVTTVPKFGLMVNRPIHWEYRNYYGNIVSLSHTYVWNSNVSTTINMNQIRAWAGEVDSTGKPVFSHFGNSERPFNLRELIAKSKQQKDNQGGV